VVGQYQDAEPIEIVWGAGMLELKVKGMECAHCVQSVTEAVAAVPGAVGVSVELGSGLVRIDGAPDAAAIRSAIERAGYDVAV